MAKDLVLDVVARKNSKDLNALADEFDKLSKRVDDNGKSLDKNASFSKLLDDQIAKTKTQVKDLGAEFDRTGDKDVFAKLGGAQKNLASLERVSKQLGKAIEEPEKDLESLVGEWKKYNEQTDDAGKRINKLTTLEGYLSTQLQKSRKSVADLNKEFSKTGDASVLANLTSSQKNAAALTKIKAQLEANVDQGVSGGFTSGLRNAFSGHGAGAGLESLTSGLGLKLAAGVAPVVLPAAGAAAGAALLAALGIGTIGAGIAGQIKSPAVQAALGTFKSDASKVFSDATTPFGGVLTRELDKADGLVLKIKPELEQLFVSAAPAADKLFDGLNGFVEKSLPGLQKGIRGSDIVVEQLGKDLPKLGQDLGNAFANAAAGARGEADALHDLTTVLGDVATSTGTAVGDAGKLYEVLHRVATLDFSHFSVSWESASRAALDIASGGTFPLIQKLDEKILGVKGNTHDVENAVAGLSDSVKAAQLNKQLDGIGASASGAADDINKLDAAVSSFNNDALDARSASLAATDAVSDLDKQMRDNKAGFDLATAAGRANEEQYLAGVQAAQQHSAAVLQSTGNAKLAAQAYAQDKAGLDSVAKASGATAKQLASVNAQLDNVAKFRKGTVDITVSVKGNGQALLTRSDSDITRVLGTRLQLRAAGGPVQKGVPYVVGEKRPELFWPDQNGTILPDVPSARPGIRTPAAPAYGAAPATGGGGRAGGTTTVVLRAGDSAAAAILALLRPEIAGPYGGSVQRALGRN